MGQEHTLNCRNNKDKEQQTQAIHTPSMQPATPITHSKDSFQPQIKSKSTTTVLTEIDNKIPSVIRKPSNNKRQSYIPQHQNLLKVAYTQFDGGQKMGAKWIERTGQCLADIMEGRSNTTMHFPQTQVVTLIESLVYALAYLQKGAIRHHDFYPINIYYGNGIFKVANPLSIQFSGYTLTQQRRRFSFLSPELIAHIVQDAPQENIPSQLLFKADIFAIGMAVLQFCTLQSSAECYDEQNYQVIDQIIKERLVKVAQLYSPMIADCIAEMLVYDIQQRIEVQDLALLVYLNSPSEKIDVPKEQQQPTKTSARASSTLPPLPKPSSASVQLQKQQQAQQNMKNMQHPHLQDSQQPINTVLPSKNIIMPQQNYTSSHLGPNNQPLLSSSSMQNKLKVIEQIHQKPELQQDSDRQFSSLSSNISGYSQVQQLKVQQQQPQRIIVNSPFPPNQQQNIQHSHHQYLQPNQFPHQVAQPIRQVILPPGLQQPPFIPNFTPNIIHTMPNGVVQGNPMPMINIIQPNRVPAPATNQAIPVFSGVKSTQVESKYEPVSSNYEEQPRYRPSQTELLSPYEGTNFTPKQSAVQKDYDLLYKPTYKQSLQLSSQYGNIASHKYTNNGYQPSYKQLNYGANRYNLQADYLPNNSTGNYDSANRYESASYANKYGRTRDQNGETLEQRVDRILKMSRGIK